MSTQAAEDVDTVPTDSDDRDPDLVHIACPKCRPTQKQTLCGLRLASWNPVEGTPAGCQECVVCEDLAEHPCPTCGAKFVRRN